MSTTSMTRAARVPGGIDELDRRLIQALQLDGRVAFTRLAAVLEVSDHTVRRRYSTLRSTVGLTVHGVTIPQAMGETEWVLRIRCEPRGALPIAEALAKHSDTAWVSMTAGGCEIVTFLRTRQGRLGLMDKLGDTPRVLDVTAQCLLHPFYGGTDSAITKFEFLTPTQRNRLVREATPALALSSPTLTDSDHRMVEYLARDGRATARELAGATGLHEAAVRARIEELRRVGVLYFDLDYDKRAVLGCAVTAQIWLSISPDKLEHAGAVLGTHRGVAAVAATTGTSNLHAYVLARDETALYTYLTQELAHLPGLQRYETALVTRTLKTTTTPHRFP
ncbi:Lrp/AsnC family transcriptional regulator [Nocardia sp. CA-128927]|uniref:Lrp/AsnC family transcriptional regulator n=1 Tax=Nocardia sp. CA-128927 TaxID=3239975 RepID=UPI003D979D2C